MFKNVVSDVLHFVMGGAGDLTQAARPLRQRPHRKGQKRLKQGAR